MKRTVQTVHSEIKLENSEFINDSNKSLTNREGKSLCYKPSFSHRDNIIDRETQLYGNKGMERK